MIFSSICHTVIRGFFCSCGEQDCVSLWHTALLLCPRPRRGGGGIRRSSASVVRPSVCLSDVAYIGSNSKTKRPRKTKLCTGVPQVTCDSQTDFKVKRSKVKVTGRRHIVASTKRAATWRTAADITSLKYYLILHFRVNSTV